MSEEQEELFLEVEIEKAIETRKDVDEDTTLVFNGCEIPVEADTTKDDMLRYYFRNVKLNQFEGW